MLSGDRGAISLMFLPTVRNVMKNGLDRRRPGIFGNRCIQYGCYAFFSKYLYDMKQEQKVRGGNVPVVVPAHDVKQNGACGWGDASVIIPWNMYLYYGDAAILEQQYESMKGWVDYIKSRDDAAGEEDCG